MKRTIAVGVHAQDGVEVKPTIQALRDGTRAVFDLFLLLDGRDAETRTACDSLTDIKQLVSPTPLGAPACFNRFAAATDADIIVFLENGALVGPGWLERLVAALDADPRNGLAGPSTNRAWNEQRVFPDGGDSPAEIARTAALAAERFGSDTRTLEPLYSLGDFCYAVKREVIDALGGADEGYGHAPCWEMDFNIRAARAGYRGVFVPGAYVHRMECSARRRRDETLYHELGKRRYQDKFCALRLRRERADYEMHCRGDACEHFAPAALIQVRVPHAVSVPPRAAAPMAVSAGTPLVTCIMPTRGRPEWLRQAIAYFQRQDYPTRELIIVDDGPGDRSAEMADEPSVRYVRMRDGTSIGAKRNRACELARGQFIAQWDDDDWYGPRRLSEQLAPLIAGDADITGLTADVFLELPEWRFWTCSSDLHRRLFCGDVHGGTLAYHRRVWERLARYPDASLAEDAALLRQALSRGARLRRVAGARLFVYVRHGRNAWSFRCGQHVDPQGWRQIDEPAQLAPDRAFYVALASQPAVEPPRPAVACGAGGPLVSCIMPTADRREFVPHAIRHFLRQDYPDRELIIVDDGRDPIEDLVPADPRIRYVRLNRRVVLGEKRNIACRHARGPLIAHWDDDDWMADRRLTYQVSRLTESGADLCGLATLLFWDPLARQAWRYEQPGVTNPWIAGGTLCYTAAHWRAHPFAQMNVGEDTRFATDSGRARVLVLPDCTFYVALVHAGNTSVKQTSLARYRPFSFDAVLDLLGCDAETYLDRGQRTAAADSSRTGEAPAPPLISCIMPTRSRRLFVPQAIRCFLRQDYPRKELIVVDDGDDKIRDLIPADPAVRYVPVTGRMSLGAKRNLAADAGRGSIVAHWDDDDWYHPQYLSRAAARLLALDDARAVCGLGTYLVWVFGDRVLRLCRTAGIAGATFVYFRSFWQQHQYRNVDNAEDYFFLQDARPTVARCDDAGMFVVVRHGSHTWQRDGDRDVTSVLRKLPCYGKRFEEVAPAQDVQFYRDAEATLAALAP